MTSRRVAMLGVVSSLALTCVPARAETATWVSTFPIQTGATERIEVTRDSAWAVIDHSRVLRSTDAGLTWTPLNALPVSDTGLPGGGPATGGSSDTSVAPLSAQVALAVNGAAYSMTRDAGSTWQRVKVPHVTRTGDYEHSDLLRRTGGRYWSAAAGFDVVKGCAVPLATTPLLSSADGAAWRRVDLPVHSGWVKDLKFADPLHGAVSLYDLQYVRQESGGLCGYAGSASTTLVFVTADGGRSWRKAFTCSAPCSVGWVHGRALTLTLGEGYGRVLDSSDLGRHFRRTASIPVLPATILGLQAMDCSGARCWALVNGTGIYRRDGAGEWTLEDSDADVLGICVAGIAAIDNDRAIAAGPHALMTRVGASTPGGKRGSTVVPGPVRVGPYAVLQPGGGVSVRVRL